MRIVSHKKPPFYVVRKKVVLQKRSLARLDFHTKNYSSQLCQMFCTSSSSSMMSMSFSIRKTGNYMQKLIKPELLFDKCTASVSGFLAMYVTANCGIKGLISIADPEEKINRG